MTTCSPATTRRSANVDVVMDPTNLRPTTASPPESRAAAEATVNPTRVGEGGRDGFAGGSPPPAPSSRLHARIRK
jgi:hypothetical protein